MKRFLNFVKKTWWLSGLLFIAPIVIIVVFYTKEYILHEIDLSAGDWAGLLGSVFTYWGTILLGMIAFWQNDRVMRLEERNMDIKERELKENNTPDFIIEKVEACLGGEIVELALENISHGMREEKQWSSKDYKKVNNLGLYVSLKNVTKVDAFDIEVLDSIIDKKLKKGLFKIGVDRRGKVERKSSLVLGYQISFEYIQEINGIKIFEISFPINYRNLYGHFFHSDIIVFAGMDREKEGLCISVKLGEPKDGKKKYKIGACNAFIKEK